MKKTLYVMVLASLALAACQGEQPAPTQSSSNVTAPVAAVVEKSTPAEKTQPATINENAVAVTKAPVSTTAQRMHEAATQAHAAMASQLQTLKTAAPVKIAEKATDAAPVQAVAMVGNATRGKSIARKCQACHRFTDKRKVGPGLKGIVGRKAGIMPDMKYSPALKAGGWVWTEQALSAWDCNSKKAVKVLSGNPAAKTKMPAQHICDAAKQADLMAFLKTL